MAEYSASFAAASEVVEQKPAEDLCEESLVQIDSRPPNSMLIEVQEDSNSKQQGLLSQLSKLNLSPDQLQ